MLRCRSTSSSEHKESSKEASKEASEDKDSLSEASELSRIEGSFSEHDEIKWVDEGAISKLSLPRTEEVEEEGREGEACEEKGWVRD